MRRVVVGLISWGFLALAPVAQANEDRGSVAQDRSHAFMRVYGPTYPPYGYVRFCQYFPAECKRGPLAETRISLSPIRKLELDSINRQVNKAIEPASDMEVYGETERWTIPTTKGDCEDYALLKRKILIGRGWPVSALLMTVVRDEKGEGHAVLTARTAQGDYVLDNKTDDIRLWRKTPYTYIMRQSYIDPNVWVSLDPTDEEKPALLAGVRKRR